jgi:hypothetical protein
MTIRSLALLVTLLPLTASVCAAEKDTRIYELRIYHAAPGKLDALHARFRDHGTKLMDRQGITTVGAWVPIDNRDDLILVLLSSPSRDAREKSWKAFQKDSDWQKVYKESEKNGKLVKKVDHLFLTPAEFSPDIKPIKGGERVFELRICTASSGHFDNLKARFRTQVLKLFEKHGMTNVGYWSPMPDQKGANEKLYFLLAHKSVEAARSSHKALHEDEEWKKLKAEREKQEGRPPAQKNGDKALYLKATDYSPMK